MLNTAYNISVAGLSSVGPGPGAYNLIKRFSHSKVFFLIHESYILQSL